MSDVITTNGKWGELEISSSQFLNLHISATCLHYGQEAFEGMKAYKGKDGKIRFFRWQENAKANEVFRGRYQTGRSSG